MTRIQRIFLSSTSADLHDYREQVRDTILRAGNLPLLIEDDDQPDKDMLQCRYDKIQEADLFMGLYAYRYGYVPGSDVLYRKTDGTIAAGDDKTSLIEWEYCWALERGLPVFLFAIGLDEHSSPPADWPREHIEEGAGQTRLHELKRALMDRHTLHVFHSPDDLAQQVAAVLKGQIASQSLPPQQFKGYELRDVIGAGGYGLVYRAQQVAVDRQVAIKLILPEYANQPDFIRGFEAEAQLIARLEHPYIVPLFDYWRDADSTCLVMRFMRGGSLSQYITGQPLPVNDVVRWMEQIGAALAFAHRHGVIHRDLKPDNLLLDEEGNAYLSDFGIARPTGYSVTDRSITGTIAYIAPDQLNSQPPTPQADLYSFGIVLYELLAGTHPFAGQTPSQLVMSHLALPLPDIRQVCPTLPSTVQSVIERATAKDPNHRYADALEMVAAFRQAIAPVIQPQESAPDPTLVNIELTNPYKGLRAFQEYDEGDFFGRDTLVEQFIARMRDAEDGRLLVVVGPSGSGKSSAVKAGLLPALRQGALPGSENWFITEMMPGSQPLEELEAALLRVAIHPPTNLLDELKGSEHGFAQVLQRILPPDDTELLLVIDQFEELFTLTNDESQRVHFLTSLLVALEDPHARLRLVLTLRADFYDKPLYYLDFGLRLRKSVETVLPLSPAELEESIVRPAEQAGAVLENGLIAAILQEVGDQPGILPLLQYALTELFERRQGRMLTFKAYRAMGGVTGALGQRAEALYGELDEAGQETARQVFLRLMTLGEGMEDTRRRVRQTEFALSGLPVIQRFGEARLLTFDRDPQTRGPTVEVAHEALLRTWQRLKDWIAAVRDELSIHRRLSQATEEWLRANRDSGFLAREAPLEQFEGWSQMTTIKLNETEHAFLEASLAERMRREKLDVARKAHEEKTARRAQNLGRAAAVFAVTGFFAIVLTAFAFVRTNELGVLVAESDMTLTAQVATADARGTIAAVEVTSIYMTGEPQREQIVSFSLVNAARRLLTGGDRSLAMHLALLAAGRPGLKFPIDISVEQAFHEVAYSFGERQTIAEFEGSGMISAFHQKTERMALGLSNGTLEIREGATGRLVVSLLNPSDKTSVSTIVFNEEGTKIAYALRDHTLWIADLDSDTPASEQPLAVLPYNASAIIFSPDDTSLIVGGDDAHLHLVDARTGDQLDMKRYADPATPDDLNTGQGTVIALGFISDDEFVAGGYGIDNALTQWCLCVEEGTQKPILTYQKHWGVKGLIQQITAIAVYQDDAGNRRLATAALENAGHAVRLWDLETGTSNGRSMGHEAQILALTFSPDGQQMISASDDLNMILWDSTTTIPQQIGLPWTGHIGPVRGAAFLNNEDYVVSASNDGTMRLWEATIPQEAAPPRRNVTGSPLWAVASSPDGTRIIAGAENGTVQLWDASGQTLATLQLPPTDKLPPTQQYLTVGTLAFHPDGSEVAIGLWDGRVFVWNISEPDSAPSLIVEDENLAYIWSLSYTPDAASLVIGMGNLAPGWGRLKMWDFETETLHTLKTDTFDVRAVAISPPGACPGGVTCIAAGMQDGSIDLWDLDTQALITTYSHAHASAVFSLAFSPAGTCPIAQDQMGTCLVSGSEDRTLNLWDIATGHLVGDTWVGHTYWVNSVIFSADGQYVISASEDKTLRLWDTSSRTAIGQPWVGHSLPITMIALNGQTVMSVSRDGTLRFWALRTIPELIAWACQNRYARPIAAEDLTTYGIQQDISPSTCPAIDPNPAPQSFAASGS